MRRQLIPALAFLALASGAGAIARRLADVHDRPFDVQFVPSAGVARWASLGHPTLVANMQWLRATQYMGEKRGDERGWSALRPLAELITDLDPRHDYAYQVTANLLASKGLVRDSNEILEKGIRNCSDKYILPFQRAVNAFLYTGDYAEAGRWFEAASRTPGAPVDRMRGYATTMYTKGNRVDAALAMLSHLYEEAKDDESRRLIRERMDVVRFEEAALAIDRATYRYRAHHGVLPPHLVFLALEGYLPEIPKDPLGGQWFLDPQDGRARSTMRQERWNRPRPGLVPRLQNEPDTNPSSAP